MTAGFDINDRATWAWTDETVHTGYAAVDDHYALHLRDPGAFYLLRDGVPKYNPCPLSVGDESQVFNPMIVACDFPSAELNGSIYAWAVSKGYIKDQR